MATAGVDEHVCTAGVDEYVPAVAVESATIKFGCIFDSIYKIKL